MKPFDLDSLEMMINDNPKKMETPINGPIVKKVKKVKEKIKEEKPSEYKGSGGKNLSLFKQIKKQYGPNVTITAKDIKDASSVPTHKKALSVFTYGKQRYYIYPGSATSNAKISNNLQHHQHVFSGKTNDNKDYHAYVRQATDDEADAGYGKNKLEFYNKPIDKDDLKNTKKIKIGNNEFDISNDKDVFKYIHQILSTEDKNKISKLASGARGLKRNKRIQKLTSDIKEAYSNKDLKKLNEAIDLYKKEILKPETYSFNEEKYREETGKSVFGDDWDEINNHLYKNSNTKDIKDIKDWISNNKNISQNEKQELLDTIENKIIKQKDESSNIINEFSDKQGKKGNAIYDLGKTHPLEIMAVDKDAVSKIINSHTVSNLIRNFVRSKIKNNASQEEIDDISFKIKDEMEKNIGNLISFDSSKGTFKNHILGVASSIYNNIYQKSDLSRGYSLNQIINDYIKLEKEKNNNFNEKNMTYKGLLDFINSNKKYQELISKTKKAKTIRMKTLRTIANNYENAMETHSAFMSFDNTDDGQKRNGHETIGEGSISSIGYEKSSLPQYIRYMESNLDEEDFSSQNKKDEFYKEFKLSDPIFFKKDDFEKFISESNVEKIDISKLADFIESQLGRQSDTILDQDGAEDFLNNLDEDEGLYDYSEIESSIKDAIDNDIFDGSILDDIKNFKTITNDTKSLINKRNLVEKQSSIFNKIIEHLSKYDIKGNATNPSFEKSLGFTFAASLGNLMEDFKNVGYKYYIPESTFEGSDRVSIGDIIQDYESRFNKYKKENNEIHPVEILLREFSQKNGSHFFKPSEIIDFFNKNKADKETIESLQEIIDHDLNKKQTTGKKIAKHFGTETFNNFMAKRIMGVRYIMANIFNDFVKYADIRTSSIPQKALSSYVDIAHASEIEGGIKSIIEKEIKEFNDIASKIKKSIDDLVGLGLNAKTLLGMILFPINYSIQKYNNKVNIEKIELLNKIQEIKNKLNLLKQELSKKDNKKSILYPYTEHPKGHSPKFHVDKSYIPITQRKKHLFEKSTLKKINILPIDGISFIVGKIKNDPEKAIRVQSILFDNDNIIGTKWTIQKAKKWIENNKEKIKKTIKYSEIVYLKNIIEKSK